MSIKELIGAACVGFLCLAAAVAQTAILQKLPDDIKLAAIPYAPGGEAGFLASDGTKAEMYTLRVHLAKDAKIPPHTHPDTPLLPAGTFMIVPAGEVHWSWAKNGDVVYQETGNGPTATNLIKQ